jgi:hypothetical protein
MMPSEMPEDDVPDTEYNIGIWGRRHLRYIRQNKKSLYFDLFVSGKLNAYLADLNAQAEDLFLRTVKEIAASEGVTEALKSGNQMVWVQRMNNIRQQAAEIVNNELILL